MMHLEDDLAAELENEIRKDEQVKMSLDENKDTCDEENSTDEEAVSDDIHELLVEKEHLLDDELKKIQNVKQVAKLLKSQRLNDIMVNVEKYSQQKGVDMYGNLEQHPEYQLILRANDMFIDIESEMMVIYRFIKQHYGKRFAELEKIVPNILDYVKVVKTIGNETDMAKVNLNGIVANTTVMVITMTASTSTELELATDELYNVLDACEMVLELEEIRKKVIRYMDKGSE
jgi:U4/U6 small nuclear ribonucleoprotein PRP31